MKRILCFGDSNTWGYDPRDFWGGRYEQGWCEVLGVMNAGENGRCVPRMPAERALLLETLDRTRPDCLLLLLGTNDLLQGRPDTAQQMEALLAFLKAEAPETKLILLSPPRLGLPEFEEAARQLAAGYQAAAQRAGVRFVDSYQWNIPLTFDGVHFTREGHRLFAACLAGVLPELR